MGSLSASDMDGYLQLLSCTDTKAKLTIANNLINYLADPDNSIECADIGLFIDSLVPWMQSSNNKVSQNGIDAMTYLADRMGVDFRPYIPTVLPPIVDRLGDSKDMVREKAQLLILKLMEKDVISPQVLFEKLTPAFSHKNGKIREEVMNCLQATLTEHGAQAISVSRLIPAIVKLLSDPMASVRDTAFNTLVEIYRHVGERLRMDLQKKHNVPTSKLPSLMARFDELKAAGDMLPTALLLDGSRADDEVDTSSSTSKRSSSVPRRAMVPPKSAPASTPGQAGAVDEETFCRAFEDVPTIQIFSAKELEEQLSQVRDTISDPNKDWNKRVDALKKIRSLLIAGAANFDELYVHLRSLECPFQTTVKDLRSQVVREACYTIAYLSEQLCSKFDHFAEVTLPNLIYLIQNSAKVMASAGLVTVRFIIRYTHSPRLIPIICQNLNSKSKDIRRACCEFLEQLLSTWSTHSIERHIALLQEAIKKGIADADLEARLSARKAYWNFRSHFPDQAESLLNSLDSSYKRALNGDLTMSNSSSSNSLHHQGRSGGTTPRPRFSASATDGSPRRISTPSSALRSNSAIDLQAAQRAKARAQYAAMSRQKAGSGASLPRPKKTDASSVMTASAMTSPERLGRTRSRVAGVSQSQPSSRSGSPSSRLSYATYSARDSMASDGHHALSRPRRLSSSSGIPRSTGTSREASRETSPNRYTGISLHDRSFGSKLRGRPLHTMNSLERQPQSPRPVMAQKILQQSREAESALADALNFDTMDSGDFMRTGNSRKTYRAFDDHSDESETSSVCSERSFDSYRRPSDSFSWSGSQQRLYRDLLEPSCKNIAEIITNCASTHWTDRKEGLLALQNYFVSGNALTSLELRKITEIFTKMFNDSHTKVFSMFLDTLNELIFTHKVDLFDWLYVLITKLLNKLGSDLLGSIQTKIHKSLTIVRDSFPHEQLLNCVTKFLVDQTQTPNAKVKVATLTFLTQLATYMEPPSSLGSHPSTAPALAKIILWTSDAKSVEIRRASQAAVIALFNLNTPQVTMILSNLAPEYQEAAAAVVQNHLRRNSSTGGGDGNCNSPTLSPRLQSPSTPQQPRVPRNTVFDLDDSLNPEEVYKSLRRTTAEIQNYSFDGGLGSGKLLDRDRDTTSQDSGISQMSVGIGDKLVDGLEEGLEALSINSTPSYNNTSPTHRLHETDNGFISVANHLEEDTEAVHKVLESLRMPESEGFERTEAERKMALEQLVKLVREGNTVTIVEQFKHLLRYLLEQLAKPEASVRILVLHALCEMLKKPSLSSCFQNYVELLVLKVLEAHKDSSKQVSREAESCAATMGTVLPPDSVIRVLNPLITTGDYPVNQAAIKMLTKLVENKAPEIIEPHLGEVMPGLIKAYDNEESAVRKSAVFCMVALHTVVGESAMQPHLASLSGSKLKLLHLYIKRAQQGSSVPTSPKNAAL